MPSFCLHGFAPPNANRRRYDSGALGQTDDIDDDQGEDVGICVSCCCAEFFGDTLDELVYFGVALHVRTRFVAFPGRHKVCPIRRLAACADRRAAKWRRSPCGGGVPGWAAVLEVTQGVDGELSVANGHEVARGAREIHNVIGALETHFGAGARHYLIAIHFVDGHVC